MGIVLLPGSRFLSHTIPSIGAVVKHRSDHQTLFDHNGQSLFDHNGPAQFDHFPLSLVRRVPRSVLRRNPREILLKLPVNKMPCYREVRHYHTENELTNL